MSAPTSLFAVKVNGPSTEILAPSSCNARKWVSTRRRPMTSPPGGGMMALPVRATSGPANKIDARIFLLNAAGMSELRISDASIFHSCSPIFSTLAPSACKIKSITPVSSISGIFRKITGSSLKSVAAIQGKAAFLFPLAAIVPRIGMPPSILYLCII